MRKTKKLVFCGILAALAVLCILGAGVLPTGRLALLCLASCMTAVICMECGWQYGLAGFAAASVVSLLLAPNKIIALVYVAFLGYYPVCKYWIERIGQLAKEWCVKVVLFLAVSAAAVAGMGTLFPDAVLPVGIGWIVAAGGIVLSIYDFAMSLFIRFYRERISNIIKKWG